MSFDNIHAAALKKIREVSTLMIDPENPEYVCECGEPTYHNGYCDDCEMKVAARDPRGLKGIISGEESILFGGC